jgi:hypothetical protein
MFEELICSQLAKFSQYTQCKPAVRISIADDLNYLTPSDLGLRNSR